jgi:peptidoglycan/xylan/chitin deacetylase (PgdA/CDA1 family)
VAQPRLTCCLTFDFDAISIWLSMGQTGPSSRSRGEFGAYAIPRIFNLLARHNIRASFCIPGHTAYAYPHLIAEIRERGHEILHPGFVHEAPNGLDEAGERRALERGLAALEETAGIRPAGYRSPSWELSERSVDLLLEYGFTYDSSCMAQDFYPYFLRRDDSWTLDEPFVFGSDTTLLELPVTWGLDDFPPFEPIWPHSTGLAAPSAVAEIWRGDFDWAYQNCPNGIFTLTMHPQVIGRGHRISMLEQLAGYFSDHDGVRFDTLGGYAERWLASTTAGVERGAGAG